MRTIILILGILLAAFALQANEIEIESEIKEVTVFLKAAQVERAASVQLKPGEHVLVLKNLSPYINKKSIKVTSSSDLILLSIQHRLNYLERLDRDIQVDSLQILIDHALLASMRIDDRRSVLNEKLSLLTLNKQLGSENSGPSVEGLKQALEFYEEELSKIRAELLELDLKEEEVDEQLDGLKKQLIQIEDVETKSSGEIELKVRVTSPLKADFLISYVVGRAGWFPKYDIRAESIDQPISLVYKAEVYQSTGVHWDQVKLKFSNSNPNESGQAPDLRTWFLNYPRYTRYENEKQLRSTGDEITGIVTSAEDGSGLPGVNVVVKGTTVGTVTDINGFYRLTLPQNANELVYSFIGLESQEVIIEGSGSIDVAMNSDVQQLSEVVVTAVGIEREKKALGYSVSEVNLDDAVPGMYSGSGSSWTKKSKPVKYVKSSILINQTTVEFSIDDPYSIKSEGDKRLIDLTAYEIPAIYEYYSVPKLDKDAFLIARIPDWDQYNFLEGEANLYFEDTYVGRSILNAKSFKDTLDISLGRDKSIVVGREKVDEFSKRKTIGGNKVDSRGYRLVVRNQKSSDIKITLFDQIPVSANQQIDVEVDELSRGNLNEETGQIIWELEMKPSEQVEFLLRYSVKYPKREVVNLE